MAIALLVFILLLLIRVPIALVLGMTAILYIVLSDNMTMLISAPQRLFAGLSSHGLLAIPLFMLAGELMNYGGITTRLIQFAKSFIGHYRGGLAYVNITANMFLASIIGSATAQIAMMSRVMAPHMVREGYDKDFSLATTAAAGMLGPLIPPSMLFIIYSVGSGQSIGHMFMGGVVPGILLTLLFILLVALLGFRQSMPRSEKMAWKEKIWSTLRVLPALTVPGVMVWGIVQGAFTPTESAAIGSFIALILGLFLYRELKWKDLPRIVVNTAITTATVTFLVGMANLFGWILAFERIPHTIAEWMTTVTENPLLFLFLVNIFLLILGMFFDGIAALIILTPIFVPLLPAYEIDPIHFGVMMCFNLTIGALTPPVGTGLYIAASIGETKLESLIKALIPFLIVSVLALFIITYVPDLVLFIPDLLAE